MRKQQTVWAEGAHLGTHLTKHRLCSIRTCQASFATWTLHLQGDKRSTWCLAFVLNNFLEKSIEALTAMNFQTWQLWTKLWGKSRTSCRQAGALRTLRAEKSPYERHHKLWSLSGTHTPNERKREDRLKKKRLWNRCSNGCIWSTCILFSSTTGPCCLSLTIVAWTTFLKAASCPNRTVKRLSVKQTKVKFLCLKHSCCVFLRPDIVLLCPVKWGCPSACRSRPTVRVRSDPGGPPGQTWVYTDRRVQKCGAAAEAGSSKPWWRFPAGGCTPWEPVTSHTCRWPLLQQGCWNSKHEPLSLTYLCR